MTTDCPDCGGETDHLKEQHALDAIYQHRDDYAQCQDCGYIFAYRGVAEDPQLGFAFYDVENDQGARRPDCPKHQTPMYPTKLWQSDDRVQFKCPVEDDEEPCQRLQYADMEPITEVGE